MQQVPRPHRYVGIDLHAGMVAWCDQNLTAAPGFEFRHHDVFELGFNPSETAPPWRPFPVDRERFSLVIAWSVFTHVLESEATGYLREIRRVLAPGGAAITTWFFFDKKHYPMMQDEQNALYINPTNPTNAVIFDRDWFLAAVAAAGLTVSLITPPEIRGFQWVVELRLDDGAPPAEFPLDEAPVGLNRPPQSPSGAHLIGRDAGAGRA